MNLLADLENKLKDLEQRSPYSVTSEDFKEIGILLREAQRKLQNLGFRYSMALHHYKAPASLSKAWTHERLTTLMNTLRLYGVKVSKHNPLLKDALERQAYRLMELVRSGRTEEALYLLLRAYLVSGEVFPRPLLEAFFPIYSPEETKLLIFSYISGLTQKT